MRPDKRHTHFAQKSGRSGIPLPPLAGALLPLLLLLLAPSALFARNVSVHESPYPLDETKEKVEELLKQLDPEGYRQKDSTFGFSYHMAAGWNSPFSYHIYLGNITSRIPTALVRLEGASGDVNLLERILIQEGLLVHQEKEERRMAPLGSKSHAVAQGLNVVAPWLSVLYQSYHSPRLTTGQTVARFLTYFAADAFLVWAGGRNWFQEKWDPKRYGGNIAAGLVFMRILGGWQAANQVRGHNRVVELKYTFPLD